MRERWVALQSPALEGAHVAVESLEGEEELNRLFEYRVVARIHDRQSAADRAAALLENDVALRFEEGDRVARTLHGIVSEVDYQHDLERDDTLVTLTVVPRCWLLTRRFGAKIFVGQSIPEILTQKLESIGLQAQRDFVLALAERYEPREIVVQYEESDHDFFSRWCEHEGIVTLFEHRDGRDVLVLADDNPPYGTLRQPVLNHRSRREHPSAYDIRTRIRRQQAAALVHDYNYRAPQLGLDHTEQVVRRMAEGDWVEYGAHTKTPHETQRIAKVRAQRTSAEHEVVRGGSTELSMRAGATFTLHSDFEEDRELLVTRVSTLR